MWRDYEDLEQSLSMPELNTTLAAKRDADYAHQKFMAALQGVDLEKNVKSGTPETFQDFASDVISKKTGTSSDDIVNLRGEEAQKAGFGVGFGLDYEISE